MDDYTILVWLPLCREVAKLQIILRRPESEPIAVYTNSGDPLAAFATGPATGAVSGPLAGAEEAGIIDGLSERSYRGMPQGNEGDRVRVISHQGQVRPLVAGPIRGLKSLSPDRLAPAIKSSST